MAATGSSLAGVMTRINGRHAFVYERILLLVVRETELRDSVTFAKQDLAKRMGVCVRSVDRAVTKLRREGLVTTEPVFGQSGGSVGQRVPRDARGYRARADLPAR
ncbi:MarR family transcriptional regulator [uncultured Enorma sp.]|uniref:MarR family transcriptional regulator n=1 Tax=uncultured Enorma sp. TaxID=1714346 RepID=UPI00265EDF3E|nr:MarR family transcriptional regulator [uncultured Enorma sp.]